MKRCYKRFVPVFFVLVILLLTAVPSVTFAQPDFQNEPSFQLNLRSPVENSLSSVAPALPHPTEMMSRRG